MLCRQGCECSFSRCVDNSRLTHAIKGLVVSSGSGQQSALNSARTVLPLPSVSTPHSSSLRRVQEITGTDHMVHLPAACRRFLTASPSASVGSCQSGADHLANEGPGTGTSPEANRPWPASRRGRHHGSRGRDHESFRAPADRSCGSCRPTWGARSAAHKAPDLVWSSELSSRSLDTAGPVPSRPIVNREGTSSGRRHPSGYRQIVPSRDPLPGAHLPNCPIQAPKANLGDSRANCRYHPATGSA